MQSNGYLSIRSFLVRDIRVEKVGLFIKIILTDCNANMRVNYMSEI